MFQRECFAVNFKFQDVLCYQKVVPWKQPIFVGSIFTMMIPCFSDNSTSDATTPTTSTGAPPPTDTPSTGATLPVGTPSTPHTVTTHTDDISSIPSTLITPTSNTDASFSNPPPSSPSASSTVSQVVSVKSCTTQLICSHKPHANYHACYPCNFVLYFA